MTVSSIYRRSAHHDTPKFSWCLAERGILRPSLARPANGSSGDRSVTFEISLNPLILNGLYNKWLCSAAFRFGGVSGCPSEWKPPVESVPCGASDPGFG